MRSGPHIVTSIPPRSIEARDARESAATVVAAFERSGFRVVSLGRPGEASGSDHFPTVQFREAPSQGIFPGRYGPSFGDLLEVFREEGVGAVVNADIYLAKSNMLDVLHASPGVVFVARRLDVERLGGAVVGVYPRGIDGMFFSRGTASEIRDDADLACFQLGAPYWDVVLPLAASFHHKLRFLPAPLLSHPVHEAKWNEDDYRVLRARAVEAIVNHAEKFRHRSGNADAFLKGLARHLEVTKPNSPLRREKRTAEYMGYWLGQYETEVAELEMDLSDPVIRASAQSLLAHSAEALSLARMLDARELSPLALAKHAFRAFRRSFKARRRARQMDRRLPTRTQ
jgi:hypothetical protein